MSTPIHFQGTDYDSVEAMPPHMRRAYERSQRHIARHEPGQADAENHEDEQGDEHAHAQGDTENDEQPKPAWGREHPGSGVPVPAEFDGVTQLGPAIAVHEWQGVHLPGLGAPRASALVLYRDGFAYRAGGKETHAWRFDEVAVIRSNVDWSYEHGLYEYTFTRTNGEALILDKRLKSVETAADRIKEAVLPRLGLALTQRYQAGEALTFGPMTIHHQHGLQIDGKPYAWDAIRNIELERGRFKITLSDGKHHEVRASAIPNIELLCRLIGLNFNSDDLRYY